ncbi:hypothetical protein ACFUIY_14630 [Streptomyces griseorubiginosus]|uniref:hypothetical protein n=1 Tax=Streptomyces griseorubiginosus TaxID=67304 RepID=UPI0036306112
MSIENTQDPQSVQATALLALATGDTSTVIEEQERAGQRQLVHSDQLPTDVDDRPAFEALGFTFGDPDPYDPLFRSSTLPKGWKREASSHDMWSYVVDELGRRRVGIFYKAAFYDRRAQMSLRTVATYVADCQHAKTDVVTDDTWATPTAVAEAANRWAERAQENVDLFAQRSDESSQSLAAQYAAERDAYLAMAAQHTTS